MDRKRLLLLAVLALLAVLVALDNSDIDLSGLLAGSSDSDRSAPVSRATVEERLRGLQRAVQTRQDIERVYREVAGGYASRVAELDTLMLESGDPRRAALAVLNRRLRAIRHLQVRQATAEEPRPQGDGISLVSVALSLEAPTHEAAMQAVLDIAHPGRGYAWEELDVEADAEEKRVSISGKVLAVMVEAAE